MRSIGGGARGVGVVGLLLVATAARATSVLVVIVDDLGADKARGFSDYADGDHAGQFLPETPTLGELSRAGLSFTRAWANPLCSPTRASLLTGLHPHHHGVGTPVNTVGHTPLAPGTRTVAQALADQGWETGLFGKWHLGFEGSAGSSEWTSAVDCAVGADVWAQDANPLRFGFDHFEGTLGGDVESFTAWTHVWSTGDGTTTSCLDTTDPPDARFATAAVEWINARTGPYLAVLAVPSPHTDADGVPHQHEWDDLTPACQAGVRPEHACAAHGACGDSDGDGVDDSQDLLYRYKVECLDATLGDALGAIDPARLADLLIVVVGDNGTPGNSLGEVDTVEDPYTRSVSALSGEALYGKGSTFESGVRVPLVVTHGAALLERWAGEAPRAGTVARPGRAVAQRVTVADLYGTLLEVAGAPAEPVDGGSFAACLTDASPLCGGAGLSGRLPFAESFRLVDAGAAAAGRAVVQQGPWRLVMELDADAGCVFPSLFAVDDRYDEHDRHDGAPPGVVPGLEAAVDAMAVGWMPTDRAGGVVWCR